ncbi:hypothetical protein EOM39_03085 [Candidatus Gracilibacteria bacterium]|nr:hypothetical protein [Candidatus Gracilibacteria bacterium]
MRKFIIIGILILLTSCSQKNETNNTNFIETENINGETLDSEKIDQIKSLLSDEEKDSTINSSTGVIKPTNNNVKKTDFPTIIINDKTNNLIKTDTGILTEEEIDIIDNTADAEIDELIDILFKDIN